MITDEQLFIIEVFKLVPLNRAELLIQSPHLEILDMLRRMNFKEKIEGFKAIKLNKKNREILTDEIIYNDIHQYIHQLKIFVDGEKIFEGYDGLEYGIFSKKFNIPESFKKRYKSKDMLMISEDW